MVQLIRSSRQRKPPSRCRDRWRLCRTERGQGPARRLDLTSPRLHTATRAITQSKAGQLAAPVRITLIDQHNYHLFQPLLYQVATASLSPSDITSPIRSILRRQRNVRVILARAESVDVDGQQVVLDNGQRIEYDVLVVATWATTTYFGHSEWEELAPGLKDIDDAVEIRRRIFEAFERAERIGIEDARKCPLTFVVVGGGPTGVELAGSIGEIAH